MNHEAILAKVRKLLALAQSANQAEAESAALKAGELMTRYNLTMQEVDDRPPEFQYSGHHELGHRLSYEAKLAAQLVCSFFFVQSLMCGRGGYRYIQFFGTPANTMVAEHIFSYVVNAYRMQWKEAAQLHKLDRRERLTFISAMHKSLCVRLMRERSQVEEEMGLVVVDDPRLAEAMREKGLKNKDLGLVNGSLRASLYGAKAADSIHLNSAIAESAEENAMPLIGEARP